MVSLLLSDTVATTGLLESVIGLRPDGIIVGDARFLGLAARCREPLNPPVRRSVKSFFRQF